MNSGETSSSSPMSAPSTTARATTSERRAHYTCNVEICPCRIAFSRRASCESSLMGRTVSIRNFSAIALYASSIRSALNASLSFCIFFAETDAFHVLVDAFPCPLLLSSFLSNQNSLRRVNILLRQINNSLGYGIAPVLGEQFLVRAHKIRVHTKTLETACFYERISIACAAFSPLRYLDVSYSNKFAEASK